MPTLPEKKRPKPTIAGQIAGDLRSRILSGELAPGSKLNLDHLRDDMSVSVSSIREAVTRLVADGLLTAEEQKGYHVAPISLGNLDEVTSLRVQLEPFALRLAIANGGLDWETDVTAALYRLNNTVRTMGDPESLVAWEQAHNAFHQALIDRCDMPVLLRFYRILMSMNDRYRALFMSAGQDQRDLAQEHSCIAEAALKRDADKAGSLLAAHIERTGASLRKRLGGILA